MFTDIVGYTALTQADEAQAMEVLGRHNRLLRSFFPRFNGREVKTIGDSFLVEFDSALDALKCAVEIQSYLHDYNFSSREEWKISLRIGIHLGDVIHQDGDVFGDAVNIASRLQPLAEPDGICVSDQVYGQVRNKVHERFDRLEPRKLKGLNFALEVYKVTMPWERTSTEANSDKDRVAVLPFANISPDSSDEYFADGLTEELISKLSLVKGLKVIARTSVMGYKNKEKKISDIGLELGVGTIVEGSVRKAGSKIRVTAQLIDVGSEEHLWASSYDKSIDDIFAVQSEVAERIVSSLSQVVLPQEREQIERRPTRNAVAYENYLRGRFYMLQGSTDMYLKAVDYLTEAIKLDVGFANPHALLARVYGLLGSVGFFPPKEAHDRALSEAQTALRLNDQLPESYVAMGAANLMGSSWKETIAELDKALMLSPDNPDARSMRGYALMFQGRLDESVRELRRAEDVDPMNEIILGGLSVVLLDGDPAGAERIARRAIEFSPESLNSISALAYITLTRGEKDEAVRLFEKVGKLGGQNWAGYLGFGYAKVGRKEDALKVLEDLRNRSELGYVAPTIPAMVCAGLGNREDAFQWLDKAVEIGDPQLGFLGVDYVWFDLRTDPRFEAMVGKIRTM